MATYLGIDLSPAGCRVIELERPRTARSGLTTRVTSFALLPTNSPAAREKLRTLSGRPAAVVVWHVRSHHRQLMVAADSYERMRSEARAALREVGIGDAGTLTALAPVG